MNKKFKKQKEENYVDSLYKKHKVSLNNFHLMEEVDPKFFCFPKEVRLYYCFNLFDILKTKAVYENGEEQEYKHVKAINYCKQAFCACCNSRKGLKWFGKLKPILQNGKSELYFITLTFPNIPYENFSKESFKKCAEMYFYFRTRSARKIREIFKNVVRKTENTINYKEYSYNLHYHLLVGYDLQEEDKELIKEYGTKTFKRFFPDVEINTANQLLIIDFQKVNKKNISNELTGYVSKASIDSIKKEDIMQNLFYKVVEAKKRKKKDKEKHFLEQLDHVKTMTQEQISLMHAKGFFETNKKNFFNISGFEQEKLIDEAEMRKFYDQFEFSTFYIIEDFKEKEVIASVVEYFERLYHRQLGYNLQRKNILEREEIFELLFKRAPFNVPDELKKIIMESIK